MSQATAQRFRFYWLDDHGRTIGFRRSDGVLYADAIEFERYYFPFAAIRRFVARDKELFWLADNDENESIELRAKLYGLETQQVKATFRRWQAQPVASASPTQTPKLPDDRTNQEPSHHKLVCPSCHNEIPFEHALTSPQCYCPHCDSIFRTAYQIDIERDQRSARLESEFGLCEACELFCKPRHFRSFYFYFTLSDFGLHSNLHRQCLGCQRREAWKMLLFNLPFVLGLPWASWQLLRSYKRSSEPSCFSGLRLANSIAKRGDLAEAIELYSRIVDEQVYCAGVKYNVARLLHDRGRYEEAIRVYNEALSDCPNYLPASDAIEHCRNKVKSLVADLD